MTSALNSVELQIVQKTAPSGREVPQLAHFFIISSCNIEMFFALNSLICEIVIQEIQFFYTYYYSTIKLNMSISELNLVSICGMSVD